MQETRKLVERHPLVFSLLAFFLVMPLPWGLLYPLLRKLPDDWGGVWQYTVSLVMTAAICLAVYGRRMPFTPRRRRSFWRGLCRFGWLGILCAVMAFACSYDQPDTLPSLSAAGSFVLYNAAIALSEEILFRGLMLTRLLDTWKGKKDAVGAAVAVSSVIFGLRHMLNLIEKHGMPMLTAAQVCFTMMAGVYLCAVYLRTGNLWICVMIHFLEDALTGFWAVVSSGAAQAQTVDIGAANAALLAAVHTVYVIAGVRMLRDKNAHDVYD